jgi:hypothetical protein
MIEREKLAVDTGHLGLEIIKEMKDTKEPEEFNRLDKVAQRACSLASSMARMNNGNSALLPSTPLVAQQQEAA